MSREKTTLKKKRVEKEDNDNESGSSLISQSDTKSEDTSPTESDSKNRPDKILWEKYRISIFSSTDNYSVAEQRAKRGEVDTSNVESDEEPAKRVVTKPIRFRVEPPDDDGSEALQKKTNEPRQAQLPVPQLPPAPSATSRASVFEKTLQVADAEDLRPCATSSQSDISPSGSQEEAGQDRASESDQELPSLLDEPVASEMHAGYIKDLQAVEMRIMVKLEMICTEFKTVLNQVMEAIEARQPKESESLGQLEMLQNPAETNEELKDICETLKDSHYRKKMIRYLTLCCGLDLGSGIRRMMRKIGTEELWTGYSLKGKRAFNELSIYDAVTRASLKAHPKAT
ncbi:uncharacterized protein LOC115163879 [Salmo trutta]|uniref:uncharacterized protein LOC115163879 n=1 Tax=Salmo trutta TaxID=8032 RepID=UPI0011327F96|nr:uncharacterized protein LOC115163879 [Salmo trutta]